MRTTDRERLTATGAINVTWSTSNRNVAVVSNDGIVKATGAGTAVITASATGKSASCSITVGYSIIVGGYDSYADQRNVLWKNGKRHQILSTGDVGLRAKAKSVFVRGSDVYIAGNGGYVDDGVWKNGQFMVLDAPTKSEYDHIVTNSIFVSDNNVYVAGAVYYQVHSSLSTYFVTKPLLWENGVPAILDESGHLYSVFVSGNNDVYAAGTADVSPVWKNSNPMSFDSSMFIESIYVYENDVYAAGRAGLWINGVKQSWGMYGNSVFVK